MVSYIEIGARLGAYIRIGSPTNQHIQAFLRDQLAEDELLLPMLDVVTRSSFKSLQNIVKRGGGAVQRDALLQELARSYLPVVVKKIGQLLSGMIEEPPQLSLEQTTTSQAQITEEAKQINRLSDQPLNKKAFTQEEKISADVNSRLNKTQVAIGVAAGMASLLAIGIIYSEQGPLTPPSIVIKDNTLSKCNSLRNDLIQRALEIPPYESLNGELIKPSDRNTWQALSTFLVNPYFGPKVYTKEHIEFIRLADEYKLRCP
ncbi:hypothetical protein I1E95_02180 [Synechococcus sp. CBW1107]|uniref:hypothetical protein n=1 Tax=Synechococcus sp. CBW1107 TaxID=2789857 RepID=UPI0018CF45C3|nr:hypothetical protein [Synechococcus sp. CBW1107]QPN57007.1 hypothetical protein I1E95_02180 [Synechococcus sp. CBW1107]